MKLVNAFAAYNSNLEIRKSSSSGGVFSLLAEKIISEGGVVYGAAFDDNWSVIHRRVDNFEEITNLRGSKYVYSHVGVVYNEAMSDLASGRMVLFSGTPCQVAAMRKFAGDNPLLLLVEIVCHGAPEPIYWKRYLEEYLEAKGKTRRDIESIDFRDKRTGWKQYNLTIRFKDGSEDSEFHGTNVYMRGFLKNLTLRRACFKCPFKYPEGSKADITLGDFWGVEKISKGLGEDVVKTGVSLVICSTKKGEGVIKFQVNECYELRQVSKFNPALIRPASRPSNYEKFRNVAKKSDKLIRLIHKYTADPLSIRLKILIYKWIKRFGLK